MTKFKPPKVIYLQVFDNENEVSWCKDRIEDTDVEYIRIPKNWKSQFKKKFPMLANDTAGVMGFIERMVGDG